jgi:hypothetical protein
MEIVFPFPRPVKELPPIQYKPPAVKQLPPVKYNQN